MNSEKAALAASMNYKLRKEAFVSNLSGSSLTDVNLVTLVAASAVLLYTALQKRQIFSDTHAVIQYSIDFLLNICAILFAFTAYSSAPIFLNLLLAAPAILLLLPFQASSPSSRKSPVKQKADAKSASPRGSKGSHQDETTSKALSVPLQPGTLVVRPFLTTYRGAMLVATAIAILAVDFPIFPRRFAKVETWGTSLMDLGVGSFVFSAGVVSARTILRESQGRPTTLADTATHMIKAFRHSIPLVVLGVVRLISVKNLDYAEHVTEYGVHWNFFFTLALLAPFVEIIDQLLSLLSLSSPSVATSIQKSAALPPKSSSSVTSKPRERSIRYDLVAVLLSISYEVILNSTGLLAFILISPRTPQSSLLVKNREGVFSFLGYLAIFLCGRSTGILTCQFHHARPQPPPSSSSLRKGTSAYESAVEAGRIDQERKKVILPELALRALLYAGLYWLTSSVYIFNLTVSRRLANLPYILWIAAFNNAQILLFALIEAVGPSFVFMKANSQAKPSTTIDDSNDSNTLPRAHEVPSRIMRAYNKNGLVVFLIANLLTGLVNLTVNTLDTSGAIAMSVLIAYAAAVTGVALTLDYYGIAIKM